MTSFVSSFPSLDYRYIYICMYQCHLTLSEVLNNVCVISDVGYMCVIVRVRWLSPSGW